LLTFDLIQRGGVILREYLTPNCISQCPMTRKEIEQKMVELARKYIMTHDPEIIKELYRLSRELEKLDKQSVS